MTVPLSKLVVLIPMHTTLEVAEAFVQHVVCWFGATILSVNIALSMNCSVFYARAAYFPKFYLVGISTPK